MPSPRPSPPACTLICYPSTSAISSEVLLVERLWERGEYRPPWLWSAVEVLKKVSHSIICDPVAAGTRRGPHNCGECDATIAKAIRSHDLTQDPGIFEDLECRCKATWQKMVELEEQTFGTPLV